MKRFEIDFQKFFFPTAHNAAPQKFLLQSFFPNENCFLRTYIPFADQRHPFHSNRIVTSVLLTKKETQSFQMPKQTL